jgi:cytochrome c2
MKTARNFFGILALVLASAVFGIVFEHEKFFPYYHLMEAYGRNETRVKKVLGLAGKKTAKPVIAKKNFEITGRKISSALLPLRLAGVQLDARLSVAATGGAITVVGDKVVVVDRLDKFHIYDVKNNSAHTATYPPLPSQRAEFYQWGRFKRSAYFRPHDLEYAFSGGKGYLIAAHEMFDTALKTTRMAVHRLEIDPASLIAIGNWERIFESTPLPVYEKYFANGAGGRLAADGDFVYLTIGDYNQDGVFIPIKPPFPAQVKTSDFGSVIKIHIQTGAKETISYGHRNPQGLTISAKGEIISSEHGPRGGDELNFIKPGRNYGWPEVSLGTDYPAYSWPYNKMQGRHDGFERPAFSWVPSIAVSNLIDIQNFHARWNGDLLVGSLKAASLYRVRRKGENVTYVEPIWIGQRIRDLEQMPDGSIVIWTDQTQLLFLRVDDKKLSDNKFAGIPALSAKLAKCLQCHHMGITNPSHTAPSLSNLVGRSVGDDKQFKKYTDAMKRLGGVWSRKRLTMFLTNPTGFAPGTSMAIKPMTDLRKVRKLIDELERAK